MGGHVGLCAIVSFVNLVRSSKFNDAKNGNYVFGAIADYENTRFCLDVGFVVMYLAVCSLG